MEGGARLATCPRKQVFNNVTGHCGEPKEVPGWWVNITEYISLREMKQGQCICPLSWRYTATLLVMVNVMKGGGRAPRTLTSPVPEFIDPRFRENKPKTLVISNWKRAFWAGFRENWVYNFGHRQILPSWLNVRQKADVTTLWLICWIAENSAV